MQPADVKSLEDLIVFINERAPEEQFTSDFMTDVDNGLKEVGVDDDAAFTFRIVTGVALRGRHTGQQLKDAVAIYFVVPDKPTQVWGLLYGSGGKFESYARITKAMFPETPTPN